MGIWGDPEELWHALKMTIIDRRRAILNGKVELFKELRCKTVHALRADKEPYV